jgi:hypothetical protein
VETCLVAGGKHSPAIERAAVAVLFLLTASIVAPALKAFGLPHLRRTVPTALGLVTLFVWNSFLGIDSP